MHNDNVNIIQLTEEMSYEPMWSADHKIFNSLIDTSSFSNAQLLEIARLHVKYKHLLHRTEIQKYFAYLIAKAECVSMDQLYSITRTLYKERRTKI